MIGRDGELRRLALKLQPSRGIMSGDSGSVSPIKK
jgi:hypothetical protein